jgi:hypothetical protein
MRAHYPTPDPSLLLREDGILVRRAAELEAGHVHDEGLSSALSVGFGRGLAFMSDTFGNGLGGVSEGQQQQYEKARKVFEKAPEFGDFFEFAFAVGDLLGWTESHDPMLAQVKAIDRLLHGYFTQVDNAIFASWSATRLAMLADLHAQAAAARETIRSIVANQDDLSDPLTVARLAHADRDSLVAVSALTAGLEGGYWLRPYSGPAVGLDDWGLRFEDRAPVLADGTVWDPRLALPTLMYALCVRVCVLKALHDDPRRYCHELRNHTQFLLSVQLHWQTGLRHKYRLTPHELQYGAGFTVRPFTAGAVDVFTGTTHRIDVASTR